MRVAAALALDAALGEPPARLHPTVWMGWCVGLFERFGISRRTPAGRTLVGIAAALAVPGISFTLPAILLRRLPPGVRWIVEIALISTTLSMRGLAESALAVERALEAGDLKEARLLAGHIVGRDTADLSEAGVARAAAESVAENTSDGVVAPMFYAAILGAPGALAYRAVNTLDSMLGYKHPPYDDLGWAPARLDDLANLFPSRLTALAVAAVSADPGKTLRTALKFAPRHASPNAGWGETSFAGALSLRFGGPSTYLGVPRESALLGDGDPPAVGDVRRTVDLMRRTCTLLAAVLSTVESLKNG